MKKRTDYILTILIGFLFLIGGIGTIISEARANLKDSNIIKGRVIEKEIVRIRRRKYPKNHFYFKLDNSNQNFTIYRESQGYSDLEIAIKIGDTLTVYFKSPTIGYNKDVYQIEKNSIVLEGISSYKNQTGITGFFLLVLGAIVIFIGLIKYSNMNIAVLLMRLVDPGYNKNSR